MQSFKAKYYTGVKPVGVEIEFNITETGIAFEYNQHINIWSFTKIIRDNHNDTNSIIIKYGDKHPFDYLEITDAATIYSIKNNHYDKFITKPISYKKTIGCLISFALISILSVIALYYYLMPIISEKIVKNIPKDMEKKMGILTINSLLTDKTKIDSNKSKILKFYFDELKFPNSDSVSLYYVNDTIVNAFAVPGGHIVVYRGIVEKMKTYEELAGLLGHEFAHLEKQHSLKNLSKNFTFNMLLSFTLGDLTGINAILLEQASLFNSLNYSREFETESDEEALRYLIERKINPEGILSLFSILENESKNSSNTIQFLSSHPLTENRIKNIQNKIAIQQTKHIDQPQLDSLFHEMIN